MRLATDDEIRNQINSEPGFISPVKIREKINKDVDLIIVADDSLRTIRNAYGGNNLKNKDLLNINIDRDYSADIEGDIALAKSGYKTKYGVLKESKGIEVGNIFQLGFHYSLKMKNSIFVDSDGKEKPLYMGCYGIGVGRTMAAIVEKHNDEKGIIWPKSVSPFQIHLIALNGAEKETDEIYEKMNGAKIKILYDDRDKAAGEKFADADLIGIPCRILVSKKTLQSNSCEIKKRNEKESKLVPIENIVDFL